MEKYKTLNPTIEQNKKITLYAEQNSVAITKRHAQIHMCSSILTSPTTKPPLPD